MSIFCGHQVKYIGNGGVNGEEGYTTGVLKKERPSREEPVEGRSHEGCLFLASFTGFSCKKFSDSLSSLFICSFVRHDTNSPGCSAIAYMDIKCRTTVGDLGSNESANFDLRNRDLVASDKTDFGTVVFPP